MLWHKCLSSPSWREFSWKLRIRYFNSPLVISAYDRHASPLCWRRCGLVGDFSHIFWDCPKIQTFWENVKNEICKILHLSTPLHPQWMILGNTPLEGFGRERGAVIRALLLVAHKSITTNWLKHHPPTLDQWKQRVKEVNCMENLTAKLQLRLDVYLRKWKPVITYFSE